MLSPRASTWRILKCTRDHTKLADIAPGITRLRFLTAARLEQYQAGKKNEGYLFHGSLLLLIKGRRTSRPMLLDKGGYPRSVSRWRSIHNFDFKRAESMQEAGAYYHKRNPEVRSKRAVSIVDRQLMRVFLMPIKACSRLFITWGGGRRGLSPNLQE